MNSDNENELWANIRQRYESRKTSFDELAKMTKFSKSTIAKKAQSEKWVKSTYVPPPPPPKNHPLQDEYIFYFDKVKITGRSMGTTTFPHEDSIKMHIEYKKSLLDISKELKRWGLSLPKLD